MTDDVKGQPMASGVDVLVVDDDEGIREMITAALEDEGYRVSTAQDGREAVVRVVADRPALVLLDLMMPHMSGQAVLAMLRDAGVLVPIVFMSAVHRVRTEAEHSGASGALAKPFDLRDLVRMVGRFVQAAKGDVAVGAGDDE